MKSDLICDLPDLESEEKKEDWEFWEINYNPGASLQYIQKVFKNLIIIFFQCTSECNLAAIQLSRVYFHSCKYSIYWIFSVNPFYIWNWLTCPDWNGCEQSVEYAERVSKWREVFSYAICSDISRRILTWEALLQFINAAMGYDRHVQTNFRRSVKLSLSSSILNCSSFNEANTILFQHSADSITRFTIAEQRPECFSYLVESGITGGRTFFACHLFEANEEKQVRNRTIWKLINKICLGLARHFLDICLKNHFCMISCIIWFEWIIQINCVLVTMATS